MLQKYQKVFNLANIFRLIGADTLHYSESTSRARVRVIYKGGVRTMADNNRKRPTIASGPYVDCVIPFLNDVLVADALVLKHAANGFGKHVGHAKLLHFRAIAAVGD